MKKLIVLFAFTLLLSSISIAQDGIQFDQSSWSEILAKAEQQNKLIFVDAYAVWCGPCKKMSREVFTKSEVGDVFNARFVNVKMDMEKGEGLQLRDGFGVMAYPTLLFINSTGDVVHRSVGYHNTDQLLDLASAAQDPDRNLSKVEQRYADGDRSSGVLYNLAKARFDAMDGSFGKIAEEYIETQDDWSTDRNMEFLFQMTNDLNSKMADYLLSNKAQFEKAFGERSVAGKIDQMVQSKVANASSEADLASVENFYKKYDPENGEEMVGFIRMGYYGQNADWSNFVQTARKHYKKFPAASWDELNEVAWIVYEEGNGKKDLKSALCLAQESVKMDKNYFNMDTVAALYYRLGKKGKAKATANEAIRLGKATGEDVSSTEILLENINKM